jgi:hypothetical protein
MVTKGTLKFKNFKVHIEVRFSFIFFFVYLLLSILAVKGSTLSFTRDIRISTVSTDFIFMQCTIRVHTYFFFIFILST